MTICDTETRPSTFEAHPVVKGVEKARWERAVSSVRRPGPIPPASFKGNKFEISRSFRLRSSPGGRPGARLDRAGGDDRATNRQSDVFRQGQSSGRGASPVHSGTIPCLEGLLRRTVERFTRRGGVTKKCAQGRTMDALG